MTKQEFIEASRLRTEAYDSESRHCKDCDYLKVTAQYADSPESYDCMCRDDLLCPAVQAVYEKLEDLKEDEDVTYLALEKAAKDIAAFSDAGNGLALSILVAKTLRIERFKAAKDEVLI